MTDERWFKRINDYEWGEPVDSWNRFLRRIKDDGDLETLEQLISALQKVSGNDNVIVKKIDENGTLIDVRINEEVLTKNNPPQNKA